VALLDEVPRRYRHRDRLSAADDRERREACGHARDPAPEARPEGPAEQAARRHDPAREDGDPRTPDDGEGAGRGREGAVHAVLRPAAPERRLPARPDAGRLSAPGSKEALRRAKARLDTLGWYPRPVRIERVHVVVSPLAFRLPRLRRFDGF